MELKILAGALLVGRLVSQVFITLVLKRQWELLKLPIDENLKLFRKRLFTLSIVIFLGNLVPILLDATALFITTEGRNSNPSIIGIAYVISNNLTAIVSAFVIWLLYRLAAKED